MGLIPELRCVDEGVWLLCTLIIACGLKREEGRITLRLLSVDATFSTARVG